ncbi:MAG: hypothetical protein LBC97_04555 [Bifidobacteriaceae bacterium]|nr:hypothetical protein [Bifidobacteriaceae bacterium]
MRSRTTAALAALAGLALLAVLATPPGISQANTPAPDVGIGTNPYLGIVVNAQEVPAAQKGAAGAEALDGQALFGVDWFHITGRPCANPRFPIDAVEKASSTVFDFCPGLQDYVGGIVETRESVANLLTRQLDWENLATVKGYDGSGNYRDYTGVYLVPNGPLNFEWPDTAVGDWITGDGNRTPPGHSEPTSTETVAWDTVGKETYAAGAFYLPASFQQGIPPAGSAPITGSDPGGFKLTANGAPIGGGDRTLRFQAGVYAAKASVTIQTSAGLPVPFYPTAYSNGSMVEQDPANPLFLLFTVIIPEGVDLEITFSIDEVYREDGHVSLAAASLVEGAVWLGVGATGGAAAGIGWESCTPVAQQASVSTLWRRILYYDTNTVALWYTDALATAPYFQQFQLRGEYDRWVITDGRSTNAGRWARVAAAYCEAYWWSADAMSHPVQNGYGASNGVPDGWNYPPQPFEKDELDQSDIEQPMAEFSKRAFACEDGTVPATLSDGSTDPADLLNRAEDPDDQSCWEVPPKPNPVAQLDAGTTVYWIYTVTNVAYFGTLRNGPTGAQPIEVFDAELNDTCAAKVRILPAENQLAPSGRTAAVTTDYKIYPEEPTGSVIQNQHQLHCVMSGTVQ